MATNRTKRCGHCNGSGVVGRDRYNEGFDCYICKGTGRVRVSEFEMASWKAIPGFLLLGMAVVNLFYLNPKYGGVCLAIPMLPVTVALCFFGRRLIVHSVAYLVAIGIFLAILIGLLIIFGGGVKRDPAGLVGRQGEGGPNVKLAGEQDKSRVGQGSGATPSEQRKDVGPSTPGTLVLRRSIPCERGDEVFVELDGKPSAFWDVGKTDVELIIRPGTYRIAVVRLRQTTKTIEYDKAVTVVAGSKATIEIDK